MAQPHHELLTYLTFVSGRSNKHYALFVTKNPHASGWELRIGWGRRSASLQTRVLKFNTFESAFNSYEKLRQEKIDKGYSIEANSFPCAVLTALDVQSLLGSSAISSISPEDHQQKLSEEEELQKALEETARKAEW